VEPLSCARPPSITLAHKPSDCSGMGVSSGRRQLLECFRLGVEIFASTAACKTQARYAIIYKLVKYTKLKVFAEQITTAVNYQCFFLKKRALIWFKML